MTPIKPMDMGLPPISSLTGQSQTRAAGGVADTFLQVLGEQIQEVDRLEQTSADLSRKAALGMAGVSLHEAQIAGAQADLHLRMLLQTRNKALEVYKEIMSMQV